MNEYFLSKCSPMGEADEKYGVTYWAESPGSQVPLMFTTHAEVATGDTISFDSMAPKVSSKGKNYMRLKSVKVVKSDPRAEDTEQRTLREVAATFTNEEATYNPIQAWSPTKGDWNEMMELLQEIRDAVGGVS